MMKERFESLYPGYDVLRKWDSPSWNEQTRQVVSERLRRIPDRRFFTELQWLTLQAVCDRVCPQPERTNPVPIAPWLDARLHEGRGTGTRHAELPPERECWLRGMDAIEAEAQHRYRRSYHALDRVEQDVVLRAMDAGEVEAPNWADGLPSKSFLRHVLLREIVEIYYAHPAAWSEIGFGGPAAPRGYVRLGFNRHDPWEGDEAQISVLQRAIRE